MQIWGKEMRNMALVCMLSLPLWPEDWPKADVICDDKNRAVKKRSIYCFVFNSAAIGSTNDLGYLKTKKKEKKLLIKLDDSFSEAKRQVGTGRSSIITLMWENFIHNTIYVCSFPFYSNMEIKPFWQKLKSADRFVIDKN